MILKKHQRYASEEEYIKILTTHIKEGLCVRFTPRGMWCQLVWQNTEWYIYSGKKGSFPNYQYRFTCIGDSSVSKDEYNDIYATSSELMGELSFFDGKPIYKCSLNTYNQLKKEK